MEIEGVPLVDPWETYVSLIASVILALTASYSIAGSGKSTLL